jgi:putative colanic acid biosynthesis acetyltransferase WcaF
MDLSKFANDDFDRGASRLKESAWLAIKWLFFQTTLPWPSTFRSALLRLFGARIGHGVVIRANVNISFPWHLHIGDHVWIGEEVMILSLAQVTIESHVCISQRAFLCTGSHDYNSASFPLFAKPITIGADAWICTEAFLGSGVQIGEGAVIGARAVVMCSQPAWMVCAGNPARPLKPRLHPRGIHTSASAS